MINSAAPPRAIDLHSHIVTADVLTLLEREGANFDTRIIERDGQRFFLIADTATRPINAKVIGLDDGAARRADMEAEGIECAALTCVPFVMYPGVEPERALAGRNLCSTDFASRNVCPTDSHASTTLWRTMGVT